MMEEEDRRPSWPQLETDNDERNRFLTLLMGECWHDYRLGCPVLTCKGGGFICGKCHDFVISNNDFAGEEDFTKLWMWVKRLPELEESLGEMQESSFEDRLSRNAFADRIYELLKRCGYSETLFPIIPA